jgi:hypothetical protein
VNIANELFTLHTIIVCRQASEPPGRETGLSDKWPCRSLVDQGELCFPDTWPQYQGAPLPQKCRFRGHDDSDEPTRCPPHDIFRFAIDESK